jgi:hypothetical protein
MHGAHALAPGVTATGAGFSGTFATSGVRASVDPPRANQPPSATDDNLKQSAMSAAMAPSVAPWVGARAGVPGDNEVGLAFTGRTVRFDVRHAFESDAWAFSLGAGGSVVWRSTESTSPELVRLRSGYGFDVPALIGWRSDAGVVSLWGGARGGMEFLDTEINRGQPQPTGGIPLPGLDFMHGYVGGVAGLAMGLRHLHVALELDVYHHWFSGDYEGSTVKVRGVTITPAGALIFTF